MAKYFRQLPADLNARLASLTPSYINGFHTQIHIINKSFSEIESSDFSDGHNGCTYLANMCKVTGKTKLYAVKMYNSKDAISIASDLSEQNLSAYIYDSAHENGWKDADVLYDAMLHGLIVPNINSNIYDNAYVEELNLVYTNLVIIVCDYYNVQHVGWFFYHRNLDAPLYYTNKLL